MATFPNIEITDQWQALSTLTGEAVGTALTLQNLCKGSEVVVFEGAVSPAPTDKDGQTMAVFGWELSIANVEAGSQEVWLKTTMEGRKAQVAVYN